MQDADDAQYYSTRAIRLPVATSDTGKIVKAAGAALRMIWKSGYRYKKAGVILLDLGPAARVQDDLFDKPDTPASRRLMRALDTLNSHYGRDTVIYASTGQRRAWKLRRDFISPRYTTDWDELLRV